LKQIRDALPPLLGYAIAKTAKAVLESIHGSLNVNEPTLAAAE
jgi:hypothetical protein